MPRLAGIVVFIVVALLVHTASAYGKLALPCVRIFYGMRASGWAIMSGIRHVRLLFKDAQLLFVRLWTLHVPNLRPSASDCACDENRSRRLRLILANGDRFCPRRDGQYALATSRGVCGFRERRPGPRCVRYSDVCPA